MRKEHFIIFAVLVVVVTVSGAVYQFFFKPRLTVYSQDRERAEMLKNKIQNLQSSFQSFKPEAIVAAWNMEVQPWSDAVYSRGAFFSIPDDIVRGEPVPDEMMLKFYYREQSDKLLNALFEKIRTHTPPCYYPYPTRFGAPDAEEFSTMTKQEVERSLYLIRYGSYMVDMLLKAKPAEISEVVLWPERSGYGGLLSLRTTGFSFRMTMQDLAQFIDRDWRTSERYFTIDAIDIRNRQLRLPQQPLLEVDLLLTMAVFSENAASSAGGAGIAVQPGAPPVASQLALSSAGPSARRRLPGAGQPTGVATTGDSPRDRMQQYSDIRRGGMGASPQVPPSKFTKAMKWLRKYIPI